ncbi:hypothetical protein Tco_0863453 [Tanacetum coccineum]
MCFGHTPCRGFQIRIIIFWTTPHIPLVPSISSFFEILSVHQLADTHGTSRGSDTNLSTRLGGDPVSSLPIIRRVQRDWEYMLTDYTNDVYVVDRLVKTINGEAQLHALVDGKKIIITEAFVRRYLQLADEEGVDCLPNSTIFKQLTLMSPKTTAWNEFSSTMASAIIYEAVHKELGNSLVRADTTASSLEAEQDSGAKKPWGILLLKLGFKHSNDSLLARGNTLRSDEGRIKLDELMALCTTLQNRVLDLEKTKTTQHNEIASLKRRQNENVVKEVVDAAQVSTAATIVTITNEEITLAQALEALKTSKPNVKGIVFQEPGESTTTKSTPTISSQQSQDKGKGITIEEPMKPMKKKDLIRLDEEVALKLQAEFDEEERLTREKAKKEQEANIALIETWDDLQAKIDVDHQLTERLQAQKQEELFNMEGYKLNDLKLKDFDSIQEMFDRAFKRVNTFEDFRTELVEGKEKRAGTELAQEITKKQKVEDDKETSEIKKLMEIIPDEEEVAIDAIPLAVKEDLETLYKLVKAKYKSTRPVEDLDLVLWNDLKTMFEPHVEDAIYMLVEKKYPLTPSTLTMMLEKKLMIDYESEMAYQLLKFIVKQLKKITAAHVFVNAAQLELVLLVKI